MASALVNIMQVGPRHKELGQLQQRQSVHLVSYSRVPHTLLGLSEFSSFSETSGFAPCGYTSILTVATPLSSFSSSMSWRQKPGFGCITQRLAWRLVNAFLSVRSSYFIRYARQKDTDRLIPLAQWTNVQPPLFDIWWILSQMGWKCLLRSSVGISHTPTRAYSMFGSEGKTTWSKSEVQFIMNVILEWVRLDSLIDG